MEVEDAKETKSPLRYCGLGHTAVAVILHVKRERHGHKKPCVTSASLSRREYCRVSVQRRRQINVQNPLLLSHPLMSVIRISKGRRRDIHFPNSCISVGQEPRDTKCYSWDIGEA